MVLELKEVLRDHEDGLALAPGDYTVAQATADWLTFGLGGLDPATIATNTTLCKTHIIPALGRRKLRDLSAQDVDKWLSGKARTHSTSTLARLHSCLNRIIKRAMARDKVRRNVVELCKVPQGQEGRPSKALTMSQAEEVLRASEGRSLHAYIVVSLLTGTRTEEMRALTWDHVDLSGDPSAEPAVPPHVAVWRSVRTGADIKTRKSRRTVALPKRCVDALKNHRESKQREQGEAWSERGLVFASAAGTELDAANVRRAFRRVIKSTTLDPKDWTPRELRHSFVSLLSGNGTPLEEISRLVGHSSTADRAGLPEADPACTPRWRGGHGSHL